MRYQDGMLPLGSRVKDVSAWLHKILKGEIEQLEVVVYISTNYIH